MSAREAVARWDAQTGILVIHIPAAADVDAVAEVLRRTHRERGPGALRRRLWDGRKVRAPRDLAPVQATAELVAELLGEGADIGRAAILAGDDAFHGSALGYASRLPEGYPLRVFRSYHEAVDWLLS
ncbi:MAG: hypothetical protein AMXMBFR53_37150 [Gemmatimonadota bacterium]